MAQDVSVKQYLIGKGHDPSTIGWDNVTKTAKLNGVDFYKPSKIINGSSYDSQQNLDSAYKGYNDKQTLINQQNKSQADALYNQQQTDTQKQLTDTLLKKFTDTKPATNPAEDQYNQMIAKIMQQMNNPQAVDPYSTPQYAAAQQQGQIAANRGIRANQEAAGASGFGRSTRNTEGAQRIQNDADQQLLTQVVPQIQAQLQNQKQQELSNMMGLLSPLQQQQQNTITNSRNENLDLGSMIKLIQDQQDSAYNKSPDNPLVKGQMQQNQLNQYKLDDYPAEHQAAVDKIKREAELGNLDIETAKFKLAELKDPNSLTNQANKLALEVQKVAAKYAEPEAKARLAQILKATSQIGAAPYQSASDKAMDEVKLEIAREQLKELKNPKKDSAAMSNELEGLYTGISTGQISAYDANAEISARVKAGLTTTEEAAQMKAFIQKIAESNSSHEGQDGPKMQTTNNDKLSTMTNPELEKAWETDPTGKKSGRAMYDWMRWIHDTTNGYKAGTSYELWKSKYGPTLG